MKTLHRYLTAQILASMFLTVAVFTFVLLLGNILKDILGLLIGSHGHFGMVVEAIVLLIPFAWVFALPMGLLTATLLVFGRFSADQELTAVRSSGISLLSLITPVLLLSLFCCVLSAWFNMDLGPRSRVAFLSLRDEIFANVATMNLPEGRFQNVSTNYMFYTEKNDNGKLKNVMIVDTTYGMTFLAPNGQIKLSATNMTLTLYEARIINKLTNGDDLITSSGQINFPIDIKNVKDKFSKPSINDMTFWELRQEMHDWEDRMPQTVSTNVTKATLQDVRKTFQGHIEQMRVVMNRQISFSFACFGFTLIGIPLGIRVHRRETNIGIVIALVLVLIYYSFIILAGELSSRPEFYPHLIVWLPNFIFQGAGAWLLWRANRGT